MLALSKTTVGSGYKKCKTYFWPEDSSSKSSNFFFMLARSFLRACPAGSSIPTAHAANSFFTSLP